MAVDPVLRAHRPLVVAAAAVLPLVACGILALFRDTVANTNAALGLVLLVVAAAATGIRLAGIVAALSRIALMVQSGGVTYGHLQLTAATRVVRPSQEQLRVAVTLAHQVGAALAITTTGPARPGAEP